MALKEHLSTPFNISYSRRANSDEILDDLFFASIDDARSKYDELKADSSIYVYLAEIGAFSAHNDEMKIDWMIFETNDLDWWRQTSAVNQLNRRGYGRPWKHQSYATPYQPLAGLNWSL